MHICKSVRRKFARMCIFLGVRSISCSHERETGLLKRSSRSDIFFRNGVPDKTCTCNVLVGRSEGRRVPASLRRGVPGRRRFYAAARHPLRPPCRTRSPAFPHCSFGGWRSQLTFGFERKWQRGASPRRRYRGVPMLRKKIDICK